MNEKAKEYFEGLKGKNVAFVGMGVANVPCAEFLAKMGVKVYACDRRDKEYIGKEVKVLFEESEGEYIKGHTSNYIMVKAVGNKKDTNKILNVRINDYDENKLIGVVTKM